MKSHDVKNGTREGAGDHLGEASSGSAANTGASRSGSVVEKAGAKRGAKRGAKKGAKADVTAGAKVGAKTAAKSGARKGATTGAKAATKAHTKTATAERAKTRTPAATRIGLIGLGNIGQHFATRLLDAGHSLIVYDTRNEPVARFGEAGADIAASALELASRADVVFLSLPLPSVVEQVATGTGGVIDGDRVRIVVDLSTTGPSVSNSIADALAQRHIQFLGAPVSGGTVAAEKGTLTVMAAGPRDAFDEVEPWLRVFGKNLFYLGAGAGLGQTMKIINNTLCAVGMVASCEALVFGVKAGLDATMMLDILNVSSGRSFATLEKIPQCILHRDFPMRFTTELIHKDIKLCIEEAEKLGVQMMVSPAARAFLAFAITQGDGMKDYAHTIEHFEKWAGVQFGAKPEASASR
jgi:3-hydroxyisobutyrate dehydrogenase